MDKFVQANQLQQVTNPIILDRSYLPTPDGILSTEIFGSSTEDRRNTFAYIDLNCHVFQPLVYRTIRKLDRRIDDLISGQKNFTIDKDGALVEDPNGKTGIEWLYSNWNKIKFKRNDSKIRNDRIKFLETNSRDQLFVSKWVLVPAFYRDVNVNSKQSGKPAIHVLNAPYGKLIRLASMLSQGDFAFNMHYNRFKIQQTLVEIYDQLKSFVEKKNGIIKKSILGKNIDYGARMVIATAKFMSEKPSESIVDFYHVGIPLSYCISCFTPFFIGWIQKFFIRAFEQTGYKFPVYSPKDKKIVYVKIKNALLQFTDDAIHKMMNKFIRSPQQRFDPIKIETEDKTYPLIEFYIKPMTDLTPKDAEKAFTEARGITYTDLFYMAAVDICKDKHVYITRYPMADYMGIFPCRVSVLSTQDTMKMTIGDTEYKNYPIIDKNLPKSEIPSKFIEVISMQNTYLNAIGGDYDGDQVTCKGVFTQEANLEAEKIMKSISNIVSVNMNPTRSTTIEAIQTCFSVTRWENKNEYFEK